VELDPSSGGGKATPGAEVRPANYNLHQDRFVGHVAPLNVDHEIGQRLHQLSVKSSDALRALVVFVPRLIVVPCGSAKGTENAFEIMRVLAPYVLFDQCDPGGNPVDRNGCGCHVPLVACHAWSTFQGTQAYGNDYKIAVRVSPEILQSGKRRIVFSSFPISVTDPA
jgi:hypothetical protein